MPVAWRLAINTLSQRRSRTALLVASVALCAALISAIACAMASLSEAVRLRIAETVGVADVRVQKLGGGAFALDTLNTIDRWPEVATAVGRGKESAAFKNTRTGAGAITVVNGVIPARESALRPPRLAAGRFVEGPGEIVLQKPLDGKLEAQLGDTLVVEKFGEPVNLKVVGIQNAPPLSAVFAETAAFVVLSDLAKIADQPERLSEVDIVLKPGADAEAFTHAHKGELRGLLMQSTAKITSGLDKNVQSNQIGFLIASVLTFLAAAFIIGTGLTTSVTERTRELAVLRCIGAFKGQLARAQLLVGALVGGLGAVVGVPLGLLAAGVLVLIFPEQLPGGFVLSWLGVVLGFVGAVIAGLVGGAWPAWHAARVSPLEGLSVRSRPMRRRWLVLATFAGIALAGVHALLVIAPTPPTAKFWTYILAGVPALMGGWFLLAVPVTLVLSKALSGPISVLLSLPPRLLARTIRATPYRHGFTSGAMMLGLAMMVSIWTNGRAVLVDWLDALEIPDAFVAGINMRPETQRALEGVPGVRATCAITVQTVDFDALVVSDGSGSTRSVPPPSPSVEAGEGRRVQGFGIGGLTKYKTSFIAFEPETFFQITKVEFVQGTPEEARRRLLEGFVKHPDGVERGAILVAREFVAAHGIGLGSVIELKGPEGPGYAFEVVGVVTSPGLDIVSKFYDIGEGYVDQALNAVFGPRRVLIEKFGNDAINLVQIAFDTGLSEAQKEEALEKIRSVRGAGIVQAGSSVTIKTRISEFIGGSLLIASVVAIGGMFVACFAVANLIVAGVQARQFEFGVLRAVGAQRGLLGRLVLGEAVIIALAACVLGSGMGTQGAWGGAVMYQVVIGLILHIRPPLTPIAIGCVFVIIITLAAAWPTAWRLTRRQPRELLASVKG